MSHDHILTSEVTMKGKKLGNYLLNKELGRGKFGVVYRCTHSVTGKVYAIKQISKVTVSSNTIMKRLLLSEVMIMQEISHPNVIHLYDFLESKQNYYLVVNYCNQGTLEDLLTQKPGQYLNEQEAVFYLKQIANGFMELRRKKILHRDFKLANILLNDGRVVIGDFGFAKMGQDMAETKLGSPVTMAYEILTATSDNALYNSKADLWSIGVVYYQLLFGRPPFTGFTAQQHLTDIKAKANGKLPWLREISKESKDLLTGILVTDPAKRMSWEQFFSHPLFEKFFADDNLGKTGSLRTIVESQFKDNRISTKNEKEVRFLENKDIIEYNNTKIIKPTPVDETMTTDSSDTYDIEDYNDIFKTYFLNHLEIVELLIYTAKVLLQCAEKSPYKPIRADVLNAIALLFKKGLAIVSEHMENFRKEINTFNFPIAVFNKLQSSHLHSELYKLLEAARAKLEQFMSAIIIKCEAEHVKLRYIAPINSKHHFKIIINTSLSSLSALLKKHINDNIAIMENDIKVAKVLLDYCVEVEVRHGESKVGVKLQGFNWKAVADKARKLSEKELNALVKR